MNESTLNRMIREHKEHLIWLSVFLVLAVFVTALVFGTLKRSVQAQTYTKRVFVCASAQEGAEPVAHKHNDDCYENGELICTLPERELHIHGDECYAEEKVLVCTLEEGEGHVHTDACYTEEPVLVCTLEESDGHVHSVENGCYTRVQGDLICTDEDPEHVHTDECYAWEEALTCEIPEGEGAHHHSEECYETQRVLSCGKEEGEGAHTHDDTCYEIHKVLICDKEEVKTEHVHTVDCFKVVDMSPEEIHAKRLSELPESDPTADVESAADWESRFASVPLSGNWDKDLLKIAETQLGYTESQRNFDAVLNEDGEGYTLKGWTRYGAWYGIPYGDWCAMFISFCLNYADIPERAIPYDCATTTWIDSLSARGMYAPAGSYDPKPGDLIFFDWEGDGLSDHVGIVWAVNPGSITTVEGNHTISVELFDYDLSDGHIQGYGILPENPALAVTDFEENENGSGDNENPGESEDEAASAAGASDGSDTSGNTNNSVDTVDTDKTEPETETLVKMPPFSYSERVAGMRVSIEADEGAFPEGTTVAITPIEEDGLAEQVAPAISGQVVKVQAVDITFYDADGNEIEPRIPIRVTMRPFTETEADNVGVVHVDNDGVVSAVETQNDIAQPDQGVAFSADSFSTYALVYTVTFAYDGEGNVYQYSMPGGTGLSLRELLIDLGMKTEANVDSYLSHVVNVAFSKPDCMTLTKEGNDWLLQSVHAFDTPESLTVTFDDYSMLAIPVTVSGIEELQLENASISSADGVFLPEDTEGHATVVEDAGETISVVEDYLESADNTPEKPTVLETLQTLLTPNAYKVEEQNEAEKAYQVFDIGLNTETINTENFQEGFDVDVTLPENVVGKDFRLFHVHEEDGKAASVEEIKDFDLISTPMSNGSELATGFSFTTGDFSYFVLSYTVDFEYTDANGNIKKWSFPGRGSYPVIDILREIEVTGTVEDVNIVLTEAVGETDENAFYKEKREDGWYLKSDVAFDDTYELTITVDGKDIKFIVTDAMFVKVRFNFDDDAPPIVLPGEDYYIRLVAQGNNTYYKAVKIIIPDGASNPFDLQIDSTWYDVNGDTHTFDDWSITKVHIVKPNKAKNENDLSRPANYVKEDEKKFIEPDCMKGYVCQSENILPDEPGYVFNFSKVQLEGAIGPEMVLGAAREFGIVANYLNQGGHTETNFAVNVYTSNANIDVDGAGNTAIPFYVGDPSGLYISRSTCGSVDLYIPQEEDDHNQSRPDEEGHNIRYDSEVDVNIIWTPVETIKKYVNDLIVEGRQLSSSLSANEKTTIEPAFVDNNAPLDFTDYPDNTTIYVNCSQIRSVISAGLKIHKLPGQSIVFNIPGRDEVSIKDFTVYIWNNGEQIRSVHSHTHQININLSEEEQIQNQNVEADILNHIFFNVTDATTVNLSTASGAFLLPYADSVTQTNGAGWILAGGSSVDGNGYAVGGTVNSSSEWHYFFHDRNYHSHGSTALQLQKVLIDAATGQSVSEFDGLTFNFSLTETENNYETPKPNGKNGTAHTDDHGIVRFSGDPFKFSTSERQTGQARYFTITETPPTGAVTIGGKTYYHGISYSNYKLKIRVVASDQSNGTMNCEIYVVTDLDNNPDGTLLAYNSSISAFEYDNVNFEPFVNTFISGNAEIKGKKVFTNVPEDTSLDDIISNYKFVLTKANPDSNAPLPESTEVSLSAEGEGDDRVYEFKFDPIPFTYSIYDQNKDVSGLATFDYVITEKGSTSGVSNDSRKHAVRITVNETLETNVTYYIDKADINTGVYDGIIDYGSEQEDAAKFKFVNAFPETDYFSFEKQWTIIGDDRLEWPKDENGQSVTIVVTLYRTGFVNNEPIRDSTQEVKYTVQEEVFEVVVSPSVEPSFNSSANCTSHSASDGYLYTISGLDRVYHAPNGSTGIWKYSLGEQSINGYKTKYFDEEGNPQPNGKDYIESGGIIKNELITYELPETGGSGTALYSLLGGLMAVTAGAVLTMRSKKNKA